MLVIFNCTECMFHCRGNFEFMAWLVTEYNESSASNCITGMNRRAGEGLWVCLVSVVTQVALYEQVKQFLISTRYDVHDSLVIMYFLIFFSFFSDNIITHFSSSIIAVSPELVRLVFNT